MLRNTCVNGTQVRNSLIFHSIHILNEKTESQMAMAPSVEHATAAWTVLGSSPGHSLLFDHNLGTNASCEKIGKKVRRGM